MSWSGFGMLDIGQERGEACTEGMWKHSVCRYKPSVSSHNNDLLSLHYPFFTLLHFVTGIET